MSAGEHLQIDIRVERETAVLSLHGELDLVNAPLLQSEISSPAVSGAAMVLLDLEDLRFIDSTDSERSSSRTPPQESADRSLP